MIVEDRPAPLSVDCDAVPTRGLRTSDALWISLRGEADHTNLHQLQAALSSIELDGVAVVHIRLSELSFCDSRAFRHLASFARDLRDDGVTVFFHDAGSVFRTMAALFDAEGTLRLV